MNTRIDIKTPLTERISLKVDVELMQAIEAIAIKENRSVNNMIITLLKRILGIQ